MPALRLLTVDARRFGRDRAALRRVIAEARPDVVCVHGGPRGVRWRSRCGRLAREAGLVVVTGGRHAGGNLLLSTLGVDVTAVQDVRLGDGPRWHPPGAALAALAVQGVPLVVAGGTLVGNAAERLGQAHRLRRGLDALVPGGPPAVISAEGGDRPGTAAWQALADGRVGVTDGLFADARIAVAEVSEPADAGNGTLLATLTL